MRKSRSIKALLCVSAAAGLASLLGANANAANTYTWLPTNNGTFTGGPGMHWTVTSFWSGTGSTYPQAAGDVAIIANNLTSDQWVVLPDATAPTIGYTIGTLIMGDTGMNNAGSTDGGTSYAQTLYNTSATLTFDSGQVGVPAHLTTVTASYGTNNRNTIYANIVLNSDLIITQNSGNITNGLLFRSQTDTFYCGNHTVTLNGPANQETQVHIEGGDEGGVWILNNTKLGLTSAQGQQQFNAQEIIVNAGSELQGYDAQVLGSNTLVINNGQFNPSGETKLGEVLGGLAGTSSSFMDSSTVLIFKGLTSYAAGAPNFSGALYDNWTELTAGSQIFSGTTTNTTGYMLVEGGVLTLDKVAAVGATAPAYAISGTGAYYGSGGTPEAPTLQIDGGAVQMLAPNQCDPGVAIIMSGGTLAMNGNSQTSNQPLLSTSSMKNSNNSTIDFGTTSPSVTHTIFQVADSHSLFWSSSLAIANWIGNPITGGGQDQFLVGTTSSGVGASNLAYVSFINPEGTVFSTAHAVQLTNGEVVPDVTSINMWATSGGASWAVGTSWTNGTVPNAAGAVANLVGAPFQVPYLTSPATIPLNGNKIVGVLNINTTNAVTITAGSPGTSTLTINDTNGPTGSTPSIYVQRGTGHAINVPVIYTAGLNVNVTNGAGLTFGNTLSGTGNLSMSITNGATLALPAVLGSFTSPTPVGTLTVDATSKLDVGKDELEVPDTGPAGSTYAAIYALIKSGYGHGGAGITSSSATSKSGVGVYDTGTETKFGYALLGDVTMSGTVNFTDLVTLAHNYGKGNETWQTGDFGYGGTVNFTDLVRLAANYGLHATAAEVTTLDAINPTFAADFAAAQADVAAVPEPASLGLLAVGAVGLLSRRRRN